MKLNNIFILFIYLFNKELILYIKLIELKKWEIKINLLFN